MVKLFLSHSSRDGELVGHLLRFLGEFGLHRSQVFCTSLSRAIPIGEHFISHIRDHIRSCEMVIFLITTNYLRSPFCLAELGAAWALNQAILPIVIPPASFMHLENTPLKGVQAVALNARPQVETLYEDLRQKGLLMTMSLADTNAAVEAFWEALQDLIEAGPRAEATPMAIELPVVPGKVGEKSQRFTYGAVDDIYTHRVKGHVFYRLKQLLKLPVIGAEDYLPGESHWLADWYGVLTRDLHLKKGYRIDFVVKSVTQPTTFTHNGIEITNARNVIVDAIRRRHGDHHLKSGCAKMGEPLYV